MTFNTEAQKLGAFIVTIEQEGIQRMQHSGPFLPESDKCALQLSAKQDHVILFSEILVWFCQKQCSTLLSQFLLFSIGDRILLLKEPTFNSAVSKSLEFYDYRSRKNVIVPQQFVRLKIELKIFVKCTSSLDNPLRIITCI